MSNGGIKEARAELIKIRDAFCKSSERKGGMKTGKLISAIFAGLTFFLPVHSAHAFHNGSVGYCEGCHNMHLAEGAVPQESNNYLLLGSDQSSTCLLCHSTRGGTGEFHFTTAGDPGPGQPPTQYTQGGDFFWLKKSYTWNFSRGASGHSMGERHGHSVVARDFGYIQDATLLAAPGGNYPSSDLHCSSCHDPHGRYRIDITGAVVSPAPGTTVPPAVGSGSYGAMPTSTYAVGVYRLLAGRGYQPGSVSGDFAFVEDPPYAVTPEDYNRKEDIADTRVAYGKGMSEWCENCHKNLHNEGMTSGLRHPAGSGARFSMEVAKNYNAYVRSGDLTGSVSTSYTSLVPFEEGTSDRSILASHARSDGTYRNGVDNDCNVMCLTCHRAHASGWDHITRWNAQSEFLTVAGIYPGIDATGTNLAAVNSAGRTQAEIQATFYGRPANFFATYQRSLCNKCHSTD